MRNSERKVRKLRVSGILVIVVLVMVLGVFCSVYQSFNDHTYTVTVTDKDRVRNKDDDGSKYLVYADDLNGKSMVFENTDSLLRWKWNSSNVQGSLKEGNTYKITVVGYRVPIFSMYENIIKVEKIE